MIPEYDFLVNADEVDDSVKGDIIVKTKNGAQIAGIDCKRSKCISVDSIGVFRGFKTDFGHRNIYATIDPTFSILINNSEEFKNYLVNETCKKYPFIIRANFISVMSQMYSHFKSGNPMDREFFFRWMPSGELGIDVSLVDFSKIKNTVILYGECLSDGGNALKTFLKRGYNFKFL